MTDEQLNNSTFSVSQLFFSKTNQQKMRKYILNAKHDPFLSNLTTNIKLQMKQFFFSKKEKKIKDMVLSAR